MQCTDATCNLDREKIDDENDYKEREKPKRKKHQKQLVTPVWEMEERNSPSVSPCNAHTTNREVRNKDMWNEKTRAKPSLLIQQQHDEILQFSASSCRCATQQIV